MINWFPGHMAKANRDITKMQKLADLFIIVLDARAPLSTYNSNINKLAPNTARIIVVSKSDLSDLKKKDSINKKLQSDNIEAILWLDLHKKSSRTKILKEANRIFAIKKEKQKAKGLNRNYFRIIVLGVPNSGKSTLINTLARKKVAKIANKPGVTRSSQWININEIQIMDTPGVLWPKFDKELTAIKLAIIGSINLDAIQIEDFAYECLKLLSKYCPKELEKLNIKEIQNDLDAYNELYKFAKSKNWLLKDSSINVKQAMKYIIKFTQNIKGIIFD